VTWRFHVLCCLLAYIIIHGSIVAVRTWKDVEELKETRYALGCCQMVIDKQNEALRIAEENQLAAYFALKKMKRERRSRR